MHWPSLLLCSKCIQDCAVLRHGALPSHASSQHHVLTSHCHNKPPSVGIDTEPGPVAGCCCSDLLLRLHLALCDGSSYVTSDQKDSTTLDLWLAGAQDKDAHMRAKAVGIVGAYAADLPMCSMQQHAELLQLLAQRCDSLIIFSSLLSLILHLFCSRWTTYEGALQTLRAVHSCSLSRSTSQAQKLAIRFVHRLQAAACSTLACYCPLSVTAPSQLCIGRVCLTHTLLHYAKCLQHTHGHIAMPVDNNAQGCAHLGPTPHLGAYAHCPSSAATCLALASRYAAAVAGFWTHQSWCGKRQYRQHTKCYRQLHRVTHNRHHCLNGHCT